MSNWSPKDDFFDEDNKRTGQNDNSSPYLGEDAFVEIDLEAREQEHRDTVYACLVLSLIALAISAAMFCGQIIR